MDSLRGLNKVEIEEQYAEVYTDNKADAHHKK